MAKHIPLGKLPPSPAQAAAKAATAPPVAPAATTTPVGPTTAAQGPTSQGPTGAYVRTVENVRAFVRYARTLKANGQPVTCYSLAHATTAAQRAFAATWPAGTRYVAYNHATGQATPFGTWAPCYAYTMGTAHSALAPSVVASLGKGGLGAVPLSGLTMRPGTAAPTTGCAAGMHTLTCGHA